MRELQGLALDLFEEHGFDAVTVEEIAAQGGVSPSTLYRYFGTKERIVTWDDADMNVTAELTKRLGKQPPLEAFRDAIIAAFSDDAAIASLRRRVRFIYANPQVHAAAIEQDLTDREELAQGFALVARRKEPSIEDDTLAGVAMAALDAAVGHWQASDDDVELADLIRQAFAAIG